MGKDGPKVDQSKIEAMLRGNYDPRSDEIIAVVDLEDYYDNEPVFLNQTRKRHKSNIVYGDFYNHAGQIGVSLIWDRDITTKRELLQKYCPLRFRVDGKQPIYKQSDSQVGKIFEKLYVYSGQRASENKT